MTVDISTFTSTLQNKLNNASSLPEKELLLLTKTLESFSSVYDMKDMATAISQFNSYLNTELAEVTTAVAGIDGQIAAALSDMTAPVFHASNPTINTAGAELGQLWFNSSSGEAWYYGGAGLMNTHVWHGFGAAAGKAISKKLGYTFTLGHMSASANTTLNASVTVPAGVTVASAVLVGSGGGGGSTWANSAGGGGALAWANFAVTPGEVLTFGVPTRAAQGNHGRTTTVTSSSRGLLFSAQGGQQGGTSRNTSYGNPVAGAIDPGNIDSGRGGLVSPNGYGGGGGAGGYTGNGGVGSYGPNKNNNNGSYNPSENGTGGAAGGSSGYDSSTYSFAGAGGTGIYGEGTSGAGEAKNDGNGFYSDGRYTGKGGSGGFDGGDNSNSSTNSRGGADTGLDPYTIYHGEGGAYGGGGGGGGTSASSTSNFSRGGAGGARLLFGGSYPNNAADAGGDETKVSSAN